MTPQQTSALALAITAVAFLTLSLICAGILIVPAVQFAAWWLLVCKRIIIALYVRVVRLYLWRVEARYRAADKAEIRRLREQLTKKELEIVLGVREYTSLERLYEQSKAQCDLHAARIRELEQTLRVRETRRTELG